jgi:hypothetical protein
VSLLVGQLRADDIPVTEVRPSGGSDVAQIQAKIDAAAATTDTPGGDGAHGGFVRLGKGVFFIDSPLHLYSGVHLVGQGPGTVLAAYANGINVIELDQRVGSSSGIISQAGVRDLRIVHFGSASGSCIKAGTANQILDCVFFNIALASPGKALNLQNVYSQASKYWIVKNDQNPGIANALMHVDGNGNSVIGVAVHGSVQNGAFATWTNGSAVLEFRGMDNAFRDSLIEPQFTGSGQNGYVVDFAPPVNAFSATTLWRWDNIHLEPITAADGGGALGTFTNGVSVKMVGSTVLADSMHFTGNTKGKLSIGSASMAQIGVQEFLNQFDSEITLDDTSYLRIDLPIGLNDTGWIGKSNVSMGDALNRNAATFVRNPMKFDGQSLVRDASRTWVPSSTGTVAYSVTNRGDNDLTFTVSSAQAGSKVRITVPLRSGESTHAEWTMTLPAGATYRVCTDGLSNEIRAYAIGTRTGGRVPVATKNLIVEFSNLTAGTYTIAGMTAGVLDID